MLRLTRTAIGLLSAQYRSVLRKCWAINVGLFGAMKGMVTSAAAGAVATGVFAAAVLMPTEAEAVKKLKLCVSQSATSTTPFQLVGTTANCPSGYTEYGTFGVSDSTNAGAIAGQTTIALGAYASANFEQSVAIGSQSYAGGIASVAIGGADTAKDRTSASANEALAIMKGAKASGVSSIAIGIYAKANGSHSIAQGYGTFTGYKENKTKPVADPTSSPTSAIAIGRYAGAMTNNSIALGYQATAGQGNKADEYTNAIAIGNGANASAENSVALGANSVANAENTISVGSSTIKRRIMNVDNGTADNDAVNLGQMNTALAGKQDTISDLATIRSNASSAYTNVNNILTYFKFSDEKSGAAATATGSNALVIGSGSSYASGFEAIAIGNFAHANAQDALAVGSDVNALATSSTAIGDHASVSSGANTSTAIGYNANASAANSVALGASSVADTENTVSVGSSSIKRQIKNVAAGSDYYDAVIVGQLSSASVNYANSAGSVAWSNVSEKPTFATVATSGSYSDLSNKPSLGSAAYTNSDAYDAAGAASTAESNAKSYADTKKTEAINAAASDATTKANTAESNAKSYADSIVATEESARESADSALSDRIGTVSANGNYISTTQNVAENLSLLDTALKGVDTAYKAADTDLSNRINSEASTRADADTALGGRIDDEASTRESADTALGGRIDNEASTRESADTALGGRIDNEASTRESADTALSNRIGTLSADGNYIKASSTKNIAENLGLLDSQLKTTTDNLATEVTNRETAVSAEATARESADTAIRSEFAEADTALSNRIGTLATDGNYIKASSTKNVAENLSLLDTALKGVDTAYKAADTAINNKIGTLTTGGYKGDTANVGAMLDALSSNLGTEITNRTNADTALGERIDAEISAREAAVSGEATARSDADTALSNRIGTLATDGNYIKASSTKNVAENLSLLDTALKNVSDASGSDASAITTRIDNILAGTSEDNYKFTGLNFNGTTYTGVSTATVIENATSAPSGSDTTLATTSAIANSITSLFAHNNTWTGTNAFNGAATFTAGATINSLVLGESAAVTATSGTSAIALDTGNGGDENTLVTTRTLANTLYNNAGNSKYFKVNSTGNAASVGGSNAVAIGQKANAAGGAAVALGENTIANSDYSTSLGTGAKTYGNRAIAIGDAQVGSETKSAQGAIAIGSGAKAESLYSVVMGYNAIATATSTSAGHGTAIGTDAKAYGLNATAIGVNATAGTKNGITINYAESATAIGSGAKAKKNYALAMGYNAEANEQYALALGADAKANNTGSVALGQGSVASEGNVISVGRAAKTNSDSDAGLLRQIVNVADGTRATDAATIGQVNTNSNAVLGGIYKVNASNQDVSYDNTVLAGTNGFESGATNLTDALQKYADNVQASTGTTFAADGSYTNGYAKPASVDYDGLENRTFVAAISQLDKNIGTAADLGTADNTTSGVKLANTVNQNIKALSDAITNADGGNLVHRTGTESITGAKTFDGSSTVNMNGTVNVGDEDADELKIKSKTTFTQDEGDTKPKYNTVMDGEDFAMYNGAVTTPATIHLNGADGSAEFASGKFTVDADGNTVNKGTYTGWGDLQVGTNGANNFAVTASTGAVRAAAGKFTVDSDGAVSASNGNFTVAASGATQMNDDLTVKNGAATAFKVATGAGDDAEKNVISIGADADKDELVVNAKTTLGDNIKIANGKRLDVGDAEDGDAIFNINGTQDVVGIDTGLTQYLAASETVGGNNTVATNATVQATIKDLLGHENIWTGEYNTFNNNVVIKGALNAQGISTTGIWSGTSAQNTTMNSLGFAANKGTYSTRINSESINLLAGIGTETNTYGGLNSERETVVDNYGVLVMKDVEHDAAGNAVMNKNQMYLTSEKLQGWDADLHKTIMIDNQSGNVFSSGTTTIAATADSTGARNVQTRDDIALYNSDNKQTVYIDGADSNGDGKIVINEIDSDEVKAVNTLDSRGITIADGKQLYMGSADLATDSEENIAARNKVVLNGRTMDTFSGSDNLYIGSQNADGQYGDEKTIASTKTVADAMGNLRTLQGTSLSGTNGTDGFTAQGYYLDNNEFGNGTNTIAKNLMSLDAKIGQFQQNTGEQAATEEAAAAAIAHNTKSAGLKKEQTDLTNKIDTLKTDIATLESDIEELNYDISYYQHKIEDGKTEFQDDLDAAIEERDDKLSTLDTKKASKTTAEGKLDDVINKLAEADPNFDGTTYEVVVDVPLVEKLYNLDKDGTVSHNLAALDKVMGKFDADEREDEVYNIKKDASIAENLVALDNKIGNPASISEEQAYIDGERTVTENLASLGNVLGKLDDGHYIHAYDSTDATTTFAGNIMALDTRIGAVPTSVYGENGYIGGETIAADLIALDTRLGANNAIENGYTVKNDNTVAENFDAIDKALGNIEVFNYDGTNVAIGTDKNIYQNLKALDKYVKNIVIDASGSALIGNLETTVTHKYYKENETPSGRPITGLLSGTTVGVDLKALDGGIADNAFKIDTLTYTKANITDVYTKTQIDAKKEEMTAAYTTADAAQKTDITTAYTQAIADKVGTVKGSYNGTEIVGEDHGHYVYGRDITTDPAKNLTIADNIMQLDGAIYKNAQDIATKQDALTENQLAAVNSGITAAKVTALETLIGGSEGSISEQIASAIGNLGEKSAGVAYANVKDYVDTKDANAVHKTGDETIGGDKTFIGTTTMAGLTAGATTLSSLKIGTGEVPTISSIVTSISADADDTQLVTAGAAKGYVDNRIGNLGTYADVKDYVDRNAIEKISEITNNLTNNYVAKSDISDTIGSGSSDKVASTAAVHALVGTITIPTDPETGEKIKSYLDADKTIAENIGLLDTEVVRIGDWLNIDTNQKKNLTNGTENEPTTVVEALNNIDASMGTIHGLAAKLQEEGKYKGNLAVGTTVEDHLTALDAAIGTTPGVITVNGETKTIDGANYVAKKIVDATGQEDDKKVSVGENLKALDTALGKITADGNYIKAWDGTAATSIASNVSTLDTKLYELRQEVDASSASIDEIVNDKIGEIAGKKKEDGTIIAKTSGNTASTTYIYGKKWDSTAGGEGAYVDTTVAENLLALDTATAGKVNINQKIDDEHVNGNKVMVTDANGQVTVGTIATDMIDDAAVTNAKLAADAVKSANIEDSTIVNADIADSTIAIGKLAAGAYSSEVGAGSDSILATTNAVKAYTAGVIGELGDKAEDTPYANVKDYVDTKDALKVDKTSIKDAALTTGTADTVYSTNYINSQFSSVNESLGTKVSDAGNFTAEGDSALIKNKTVVNAIKDTASKVDENTAAINTINGGAVMNSGITAAKVEAYDALLGDSEGSISKQIANAIGDLGKKAGDTPYANVKDYVDTKDANTVHKTGEETITGDKTFSGTTTMAGLTAGATTLASLGVTSNATIGGTLDVTGKTTLSSLAFGSGSTVDGIVTSVTADTDKLITSAAVKTYADAITTAYTNALGMDSIRGRLNSSNVIEEVSTDAGTENYIYGQKWNNTENRYEAATVADNLLALDKQVKTNADNIATHTQQITGLIESSIGDLDGHTVADLLADKADKANTYTKTEVDSKVTGVDNRIGTIAGTAQKTKDSTDYAVTGTDTHYIYGKKQSQNEDSSWNPVEDATVAENLLALDKGLAEEVTRAEGVEGALADLTTDAKGNLVAAINEVDAHSDLNTAAIEKLNSDKTVAGSVDYKVEQSRAALQSNIDAKLDSSTFNAYKTSNDTAVAAKAEKTYVDDELAKKVDSTTYNTDMATKANASDLTALSSKVGSGTLETTAQNVIDAINEVRTLADAAQTAEEVEAKAKAAADAVVEATADEIQFKTSAGTVEATTYTQSKVDSLLNEKVSNAGNFTTEDDSTLVKNKTVVEAIKDTASKVDENTAAITGLTAEGGAITNLSNKVGTIVKNTKVVDEQEVEVGKLDPTKSVAENIGILDNAITAVEENIDAVEEDIDDIEEAITLNGTHANINTSLNIADNVENLGDKIGDLTATGVGSITGSSVAEKLTTLNSNIGAINTNLGTIEANTYHNLNAAGAFTADNTVAKNFESLDAAIGDRSGMTFNGTARGYTIATGSSLASAISQVASNIGTAAQLSNEEIKTVTSNNTVNQNIAALRNTIADMSGDGAGAVGNYSEHDFANIDKTKSVIYNVENLGRIIGDTSGWASTDTVSTKLSSLNDNVVEISDKIGTIETSSGNIVAQPFNTTTNTVADNLESLDAAIGRLTDLDTNADGNLVAAINEVRSLADAAQTAEEVATTANAAADAAVTATADEIQFNTSTGAVEATAYTKDKVDTLLSQKVTNAGNFTADDDSALIKNKTVVEAIRDTASQVDTNTNDISTLQTNKLDASEAVFSKTDYVADATTIGGAVDKLNSALKNATQDITSGYTDALDMASINGYKNSEGNIRKVDEDKAGTHYVYGTKYNSAGDKTATVAENLLALDTGLATEVSRAQGVEATLTSDLAAEVLRAQGAEATLTSDLATEVSRATIIEGALKTNIETEVSRAQVAEGILTNNLATEVSRAQGAESTLQSNIASEAETREEADEALGTRIDEVLDGTTQFTGLKLDSGAALNGVSRDIANDASATHLATAEAVKTYADNVAQTAATNMSDALGVIGAGVSYLNENNTNSLEFGKLNSQTTVGAALGTLAGQIKTNETAIGTIASLRGNAEGKTNLVAAINAVDSALDGRLDVIEGNEAQVGSVKNAIKQAKDYTDALEAGQVTTNKEAIASIKSDIAVTANTQYAASGDRINVALEKVSAQVKTNEEALDKVGALTASDLQGTTHLSDTTLAANVKALDRAIVVNDGKISSLEGKVGTAEFTGDNVQVTTTTLTGAVNDLDEALTSEAETREEADEALGTRIDEVLDGTTQFTGLKLDSGAALNGVSRDIANDASATHLATAEAVKTYADNVAQTAATNMSDALGVIGAGVSYLNENNTNSLEFGKLNSQTTVGAALGTLAGQIKTNETAIGTIASLRGNAEGKTNLVAAINAVDSALDGRLDVIEGNEAQVGSVKNAIKQAKDYTDALEAGQVTMNKNAIATINTNLGTITSSSGNLYKVAAFGANNTVADNLMSLDQAIGDRSAMTNTMDVLYGKRGIQGQDLSTAISQVASNIGFASQITSTIEGGVKSSYTVNQNIAALNTSIKNLASESSAADAALSGLIGDLDYLTGNAAGSTNLVLAINAVDDALAEEVDNRDTAIATAIGTAGQLTEGDQVALNGDNTVNQNLRALDNKKANLSGGNSFSGKQTIAGEVEISGNNSLKVGGTIESGNKLTVKSGGAEITGATALNGDVTIKNGQKLTFAGAELSAVDKGINAVSGEGSDVTLATTATVMESAENGKFSVDTANSVLESTDNTIKTALNTLGKKVYSEAETREQKDTLLSNRIGSLDEDGNYVKKSATKNIAENLSLLDKGLAKEVTDRTEAVNAEKQAREEADTVLQQNIDALGNTVTTNLGTITSSSGNLYKVAAFGANNTVADNLMSLDQAIGDRSAMTNTMDVLYGKRGIQGQDLSTAISQVASNIGFASQITSTIEGGVKSSYTVNQNIAALNTSLQDLIGKNGSLASLLGTYDTENTHANIDSRYTVIANLENLGDKIGNLETTTSNGGYLGGISIAQDLKNLDNEVKRIGDFAKDINGDYTVSQEVINITKTDTVTQNLMALDQTIGQLTDGTHLEADDSVAQNLTHLDNAVSALEDHVGGWDNEPNAHHENIDTGATLTANVEALGDMIGKMSEDTQGNINGGAFDATNTVAANLEKLDQAIGNLSGTGVLEANDEDTSVAHQLSTLNSKIGATNEVIGDIEDLNQENGHFTDDTTTVVAALNALDKTIGSLGNTMTDGVSNDDNLRYVADADYDSETAKTTNRSVSDNLAALDKNLARVDDVANEAHTALGGEFAEGVWNPNINTNGAVSYGALDVHTVQDALTSIKSTIGSAEAFVKEGENGYDYQYNGVQADKSVNANIAAVNATLGDMAKLNTDGYNTYKNLSLASDQVPTNVIDALNNIDATLGTVHGLAESLGENHQGNLAAANNGRTTVSEHLTSLDASIGNRSTISFAAENVTPSYTMPTETMNVSDAVSYVASHIGTAEHLETANYNGLTASNTVNQNLAAINTSIGDVSKLREAMYATNRDMMGEAIDTSVTDAITNLDTHLGNLYDYTQNTVVPAINTLHNRYRRLRKDFESGMASMAAMSALAPNARAMGDTQLSVGTGAYSGHTAAAVGAYHWLTDNLMFNIGAAWGGDSADNVYRMGVTYSW